MAYQPIHLENLTELKTRVGGTTTPTLATIMGINYPTEEAWAVYAWFNTSTETPDDFEIVQPTPRIGQPGRWIRVNLSVAPHIHSISEITGLQNQLNSVPNFVKAITELQISNWDTAFSWGNHAGLYKLSSYVPSWSEITDKPISYTPATHTHNIGDITNLTTMLSNKSNVGHTHLVTDITNLQTLLDNKASLNHTHTKSDIGLSNVDNTTDLNKPVSTATQTALNSKQNTLSLTTTGVGSATLSGSTLNIPNPSNMFVVNNATVGLSRATLNSTYPSTPVGYMVLCPSILLGGAVYIRTTTGASGTWQLISAPPVS